MSFSYYEMADAIEDNKSSIRRDVHLISSVEFNRTKEKTMCYIDRRGKGKLIRKK